MVMESILVIFVVFLGVCLGSFVNALVWRVHKQAKIDESKTKDKKAAKKKYSVVTARSMCPHCRHELGALDLVPIFSWVFLRGKCRYCKAPIAAQYPIVEIIGGVFAAISYASWPYALGTTLEAAIFVLWMLLFTVLLALAVYDVRWRLLPDRLVLPATILGVAFLLAVAMSTGDWLALGHAIIAGAFFAVFFYGIFQISGGRWIGGGDVKLAFLLGLLAGSLLHVVLLLFIASVLGTLAAIVQAARSKLAISSKTEIAFGPWLLLAGIIVFLWADDILAAYARLLGVA